MGPEITGFIGTRASEGKTPKVDLWLMCHTKRKKSVSLGVMAEASEKENVEMRRGGHRERAL